MTIFIKSQGINMLIIFTWFDTDVSKGENHPESWSLPTTE